MNQTRSSLHEGPPLAAECEPLDLVVPYTTPRLTEAALKAANRLGAGLDAVVRMVKVQMVPFPLDLTYSPIPLDFLESQLMRLGSEVSALPFTAEIRLAREWESGLLGTLRFRSMIVLAYRKRPWRTRTERYADSLRAGGYTVVLVNENEHA